MSIILQSSGGGSVTIAEPATASNFTLDLPASTGTVLTTTAPKVGNVIQVVQGSTTTSVTLAAGTSFTASNLAASITPSSSSSKILILVTQELYQNTGANSGILTIYRGSTSGTNLGNSSFGFVSNYTFATAIASGASAIYLDSPSTTSSTTYITAIRTEAGTVITCANSQVATMILMEIAA